MVNPSRAAAPARSPSRSGGVSTAPLTGGKTFYIHVLQNPGAVLEIPVAKKAKVKSVTALYDGTALSVKKVGENLFITLPADASGGGLRHLRDVEIAFPHQTIKRGDPNRSSSFFFLPAVLKELLWFASL